MKKFIIIGLIALVVGCVTAALPKDPMITCILAKCKIEPAKVSPEEPER